MRGGEEGSSPRERGIGGALLRASVAQQKYCGIRVQGREDVRIVSSTVEALGPCGIRVSGISEGPGLHVGDDS